MTIGLFGQWSQLLSERRFYRSGEQSLCAAFPTLPVCGQFN
jgi:hypothetical protein